MSGSGRGRVKTHEHHFSTQEFTGRDQPPTLVSNKILLEAAAERTVLRENISDPRFYTASG